MRLNSSLAQLFLADWFTTHPEFACLTDFKVSTKGVVSAKFVVRDSLDKLFVAKCRELGDTFVVGTDQIQ